MKFTTVTTGMVIIFTEDNDCIQNYPLNRDNKNKTRLFSISLFSFRFIYKNHDETDCVSKQFRKKNPI